MVWRVPFGWQSRGKDQDDPVEPIGRFATETTQIFSISENGDFKIEKLGHSSERKINGDVFTDGHAGFFPAEVP